MAHSIQFTTTSAVQDSVPDTPTSHTARNSRPDSLSIPLGQPSISFRPPVHRKHDNSHQPKGKSKAPPRTAYTDVPLRLFGSQSDPEDLLNQHSPTKTSPAQVQRPTCNASGQHRMTSIEEDAIEAECSEDVFLDNARDDLVGNSTTSKNNGNQVTMTGTIRRGQKQDVVRVSLSQHEVNALNRASRLEQDKRKPSKCGSRMGPHIVLLSLLYLPLAFVTSFIVSFYIGTMCWYNIYIYLSEEKSIAHKILLCPLLIVLYPVLIVLFTLGIALYAAVMQLSWYFSSWYKEIKDFDKNFYGCLCEKLHVPQCSPYEVVIIDDGGDAIGDAPDGEGEDHLLQDHVGRDENLAEGTQGSNIGGLHHKDQKAQANARALLLKQIRQNSSSSEDVENNHKDDGGDSDHVEIANHLDSSSSSDDSRHESEFIHGKRKTETPNNKASVDNMEGCRYNDDEPQVSSIEDAAADTPGSSPKDQQGDGVVVEGCQYHELLLEVSSDHPATTGKYPLEEVEAGYHVTDDMQGDSCSISNQGDSPPLNSEEEATGGSSHRQDEWVYAMDNDQLEDCVVDFPHSKWESDDMSTSL